MPVSVHQFRFLSTLSLRRATSKTLSRQPRSRNFYPRSPCGERLKNAITAAPQQEFLSTLSLRRATLVGEMEHERRPISIHALLAESDNPAVFVDSSLLISIHALLAESDGTLSILITEFSGFLSTLSLRRATGRHRGNDGSPIHFYPRSPCGERLGVSLKIRPELLISIHALLAESDLDALAQSVVTFLFLSTLSLRRATAGDQSTAPAQVISIHALLAESDQRPAHRP